jgi:hypothetical protein
MPTMPEVDWVTGALVLLAGIAAWLSYGSVRLVAVGVFGPERTQNHELIGEHGLNDQKCLDLHCNDSKRRAQVRGASGQQRSSYSTLTYLVSKDRG